MDAPIHATLSRAEWQPLLFGELNRAWLAQCDATWPLHRVAVRIHRNHAVEPVTSAAAPFAAWNGIAFDWKIGPYDDSLSFVPESDAEVDLVWLDTARLTGLAQAGVGPWLVSRLQALRSRSSNPIVVLAWPLSAGDRSVLEGARLPGVHVADLDALARSCGTQWLDRRAESLSGTRLSNRACLGVARELACRWLPACVRPPVKCVVVDLDDTLYAGVLGEDGVDGVAMTEGHRALQEYLMALTRAGVLLAVTSRNDPADVRSLFARRSDFPLHLDDFSVVDASWDDKAASLARIARELRIGEDAMVFVDDNPGELAAVAAASPVVTVQARTGGEATRNALAHVAGLWQWRAFAEDGLRAMDLKASGTRTRIGGRASSPEDYLRELKVTLHYYVGVAETVARLAELARKTNQFNLSLRRSNESEIAERLARHPANVVAIGLSDRLSDSGIVGAVVGACEGDVLRIEELAISCRALGRQVEDSMLAKALLFMTHGRGVRRVCFDVGRGARNAPARDWLAAFAGAGTLTEAASVFLPIEAIAAKHVSQAIELRVTASETVE